PSCASAPPVKGLLRLPIQTRKQFFGLSSSFFQESPKTAQYQCIEAQRNLRFGRWHRCPLLHRDGLRLHILGYPQAYPQEAGFFTVLRA
ncbi:MULTISPECIES: hypothetical protein, partial [unclassified Mameliella]|uniref:hypothetical protein n=1 Tax=unclassified Mameliella TaxID=2630630 RepID=UPI00273FD2A2